MANSVGQIGLDLCLNKNAFNKEINGIGNYAQSTLSKSFAGVGKVLGGVVAGIGLAKFTSDCLRLGSNLAEVQNVVDVTFGGMSKYINDFAENQALSFGLSETSAKQYTGVLGSMLKSMGLGTSEAKDMSIEMTKLAGDMASFYNLDTDLAFEKIRAGISGETEPLKQLGINMSVANLEAYAMSQGITQSYQKMDQASQALLRYNYLMSTTADAQGDFARTGGGWANQVRMMKLQWDSFRASMGQVFIAVLLPVVQMLNKVLGYVNVVTKSFAKMVSVMTGTKISASTSAVSSGMGDIASGATSASDAVDGVTDSTTEAGKAAKKAKKAFSGLLGIDEANILSTANSDSGDGGTGGGGKLATTDTSGAVEETVDETMETSNKLLEFFKPLSDSWIKYGPGIVSNFKSAWGNIVAVAMSAVSIISSNWDSWFSAWSNGIMSIGNIFSLVFKGATILFRSAWDNGGVYLFDQLLKLWTNLMRLGTVINDNLIAPFLEGINKNVLPTIGKLIGSGLLKIGIAVNWLNTKISDFVNGFGMSKPTEDVINFKNVFKTSFNDVFGVIAAVVAGMGTFKVISSTLDGFGGAFKWVSTALSPVVRSIKVFFAIANSGIGVTGALQVVLSSIGQTLLGIGQALLGLLNPFTLIALAIAGFVAGFVYLYSTSVIFRNQINGIFTNIATNISGIITGIIAIIKTFYDLGIKPVIDSTMAAFGVLWNNGLSVLIQNVSVFALQFINMIMSIWNNAINPFINLMLTILLPIFTTVWNGILAVAVPIIEKIMEYVNMFTEVLNMLMDVLNTYVWPIFKVVFDGLSEIVLGFWTFIKPIFDWFMVLLSQVVSFALDYFLSPLTILFKTIVQVVKDIVGPISQVFEGIKQVFQGIIDFVMGIFTGDWSRAMEGIKGIFSGVWNSLVGIVQTVWNAILSLFGNAGSIFSGVVGGIADVFKNIVNCIISGINAVLAFPFNKINGLLNDIRETSFMGITPFDFIPYNVLPVPQIPMLAQGGYVGANQPQLAMIGDNKRYGEIVAPEDKLYSVMSAALNAHQGQAMDTSVIEELLRIIIKILEELDLVAEFDVDGFVRLISNRNKRLNTGMMR